jgi:hypothetical protein
MTTTVAAWAQRAATLPAALVEATPRAVKASGALLEDAARVKLLSATGGDMRLSRVRSGKGATVKLELKVLGSGSGARAVVNPTGPVMLLEDRTKPHRSPFRYSGTTGAGGRRRYATAGEQLASGGTARRKRSRGRGVLYIPGVGFRQFADHPGTRGKRPVRNAFHEHADEAGRAGLLVFTTATRNHLDK